MGAILSFYGFQSKHIRSQSAVTAIAVCFCAGVILLALAAIVFSKQMKLDRAHLVVLQEVARLKQAVRSPISHRTFALSLKI